MHRLRHWLHRHHGQLILHCILALLAFLTFVPLVTLLSLSVKDVYQLNVAPMGLTLPMRFENYALAWKFIRDPILHNVIVASVATCASLIMATLSAFVFARFRFPGSRWAFLCNSHPALYSQYRPLGADLSTDYQPESAQYLVGVDSALLRPASAGDCGAAHLSPGTARRDV